METGLCILYRRDPRCRKSRSFSFRFPFTLPMAVHILKTRKGGDLMDIRYFLGANSAAGFSSHYHEILPGGESGTLRVLKGGSGCGKTKAPAP